MCKEFNLVEAEDRNLPPSRKWITWNNIYYLYLKNLI